MATISPVESEQVSGAADYYSSVDEEYTALTAGAALLDRSHVGRLRFTGEDALELLDRLSTNELSTLETGTGRPTVLTSNKGRIVDLLFVLRLDDHLTVLTAPETRQKVTEWIDFFTFTEDVTVQDATPETVMLGLTGPDALAKLAGLAGTSVSAIDRHGSAQLTLSGVDATVVRTDFLAQPGYDVIAPATDRAGLWSTLVDAGLTPVGAAAERAVRIERGVPAYGSEMSEEFNPLEAGLIDLVSFTKGCYVGQEVVTRLNTYEKVQKSLVGLLFDSEKLPAPPTRILQGDKQVGVVTSAVASPRLERGIGLGYVRKALSDAGTVLELESEGDPQTAQVAGLPFD